MNRGRDPDSFRFKGYRLGSNGLNVGIGWVFRNIKICKLGHLFTESEPYIAGGTIPVLCHDNLGNSNHRVSILILIKPVFFGAVNEEYHIGILLNGTRLAQIG